MVASRGDTRQYFTSIQETLVVSAGSGFAAVENSRLQKLVCSSRQKNKLSRSRKSCRRLLHLLPLPSRLFQFSTPPPCPRSIDSNQVSVTRPLAPLAKTYFRGEKLQPIDPLIITFPTLCILSLSLPQP